MALLTCSNTQGKSDEIMSFVMDQYFRVQPVNHMGVYSISGRCDLWVLIPKIDHPSLYVPIYTDCTQNDDRGVWSSGLWGMEFRVEGGLLWGKGPCEVSPCILGTDRDKPRIQRMAFPASRRIVIIVIVV